MTFTKRTKNGLIHKLRNLGWGDILYGYDKAGWLINVCDYDEERDIFNCYDHNCKPMELKFKDIPSVLFQA